MKIRVTIIAFSLLAEACHSPQINRTKTQSKATIKTDSSTNKEYLDWSKVKLNGTIPMISSFKEVVKQLGKPDKIDTLTEGANGSYYNKKFQYCYFKGATFEKYSDTLVFSELDFSKRTPFYLTDGRIRFDGSSRDFDFKKL